jgi:PAS domain S-box-containing protein
VDEHGVYTYASPKVKDLLGYEPAEVVGRTPFDFMPPEDAERVRQDFRRCIEGRLPLTHLENVNCHKSGRRVVLETSGVPIFDAQGAFCGYRGVDRDITRRKETEEALRHRQAFEQLITAISARLVHIDLHQTDAALGEALADLGRFAGVDRSYLFEFDEGRDTMRNTHEWCAEGIQPHLAELQNLAVADFPQVAEQVRQGRVAQVPRVQDLPPEEAAAKREFQREGIQSLVLIPTVCRGKVVGFLGLDSVRTERTWSAEMVGLLQITANVLAGAMARRRAEQDLRDSEDRYRTLSELTSDFAVAFDLVADGPPRLAWLTDGCARITGYSREECLTMGGLEGMILPEDSPQARSDRDAAMRGEPRTSEFRIRTKIGTVRHLISHARLLWNAEQSRPARLVVAFQDVTEHRQHAEALRASEDRFRSLFEGVPIGLARVTPAGELLAVNAALVQMLGYPDAARLKAVNATRLYVDAADRQQQLERVREGITVDCYEAPLRRLDQRIIWARIRGHTVRDASGRIQFFETAVEDITERRRTEEALVSAAREWQTTFDAVTDAVWVLDADQRILHCNQATRRLLGKEPHEVKGRLCYEVVHGSPQPLKECPIERMKVSRTRERTEIAVRDRWYAVSVDPIFDAAGSLRGAVHIMSDITDRRRADAERQKIERKLQEAQKLESLGVLAGGIAHDFNNLLTGILGNASLARLELPLSSDSHAYLDQIVQSAQRAAELCKQMLAYSGQGRFVMQRLDLSAVVAETTQLLRLSISKKAALKFELARDLPAIIADPTQIRQIIMNLVINASDAIGDRPGVILLSTRRQQVTRADLADTYLSPDLPEGVYVSLEVTDDGSGMSPETLARIFDPFFTTKFTGRGLGLAAVLGIVRGHKGALKVQSEPDRGTTFRLLLPGVEGAAEPGGARAAPHVDWRGHGLVLVADDEPTVRTVASRMLRGMGFTVIEASDGQQAVAKHREHASSLVAVVLDLTMPHLDGVEALKAMRRLGQPVRAVLMSGYNVEEAADRFAGQGVAQFIQKPFQAAELREKMHALLTEHGT